MSQNANLVRGLDEILSTPIEAVPELVRRMVCDRALSATIHHLNCELKADAAGKSRDALDRLGFVES